jgi:hypothetical protein
MGFIGGLTGTFYQNQMAALVLCSCAFTFLQAHAILSFQDGDITTCDICHTLELITKMFIYHILICILNRALLQLSILHIAPPEEQCHNSKNAHFELRPQEVC